MSAAAIARNVSNFMSIQDEQKKKKKNGESKNVVNICHSRVLIACVNPQIALTVRYSHILRLQIHTHTRTHMDIASLREFV